MPIVIELGSGIAKERKFGWSELYRVKTGFERAVFTESIVGITSAVSEDKLACTPYILVLNILLPFYSMLNIYPGLFPFVLRLNSQNKQQQYEQYIKSFKFVVDFMHELELRDISGAKSCIERRVRSSIERWLYMRIYLANYGFIAWQWRTNTNQHVVPKLIQTFIL